jgi:hypothetical protein
MVGSPTQRLQAGLYAYVREAGYRTATQFLETTNSLAQFRG